MCIEGLAIRLGVAHPEALGLGALAAFLVARELSERLFLELRREHEHGALGTEHRSGEEGHERFARANAQHAEQRPVVEELGQRDGLRGS